MKIKGLINSFLISICLLLSFSWFVPAMAATDPLDPACEQAPDSSLCQNKTSEDPLLGPDGVITAAIQILTIIVGVASVVMIIIGGLKYILSSGDSSNVETAKNTILYAVIGLVIALAAQAIVVFVLRRL